ncbi:MAG: hypothetical protein NC432_15505 [Roseburia sp.]|nr:hypothetical protein [Roseburia sp.]MCM1099716.1 hypothetical protein [Ruminococcus flavefaciens]
MNSKDLYNAIGKVDDDILEQSETIKRKRQRLKWGTLAATAACLCLIAGGGLYWRNSARTGPRDLPMLQIPDSAGEGMGYEAFLLYDSEELENGNPWREDMAFSTLPVFTNHAYHPAGEPVGLTEEAILERLQAACEALGLASTELEYERSGENVLAIAVQADGTTVRATANGEIHVEFEDGFLLPEDLHFTWDETSRPEAEDAMTFFARHFEELLDFEKPRSALTTDYSVWTEYDQAGNSVLKTARNWHYKLYDDAGDETRRLLNYNLRYATFYADVTGRGLSGIVISDGLSCAEKLGDYPVITLTEAREALLAGNYITSVPYEIPDETWIRKEELVYRSGPLQQTLMPYYRFYVESPEPKRHEEDPAEYGAYYVPAVSPEYLSDLPLWDGSIN